MLPLGNLPSELLDRIHRGIDLAAEHVLRARGRFDHVAEPHAADHKQIDVAGVRQLGARCRPVNRRGRDTVVERPQRIANHVHQAGRLREQRSELREHRRQPIGLEVHLPALFGPGHQSRADQRPQLAQDGSRRHACLANDLPQEKGLVRVTEEPAEYSPPGAPEQH